MKSYIQQQLEQIKRLDMEAKSDRRMDVYGAIFQKTNRILSGRPINVVVERAQQGAGPLADAPGWTDGETITFNMTVMKKALRRVAEGKANLADFVRELKGVNYHELAHCLFCPRMNDEVPKNIIRRCKDTGDNTYWWAFNVLQDQRDETMFTALYTPAAAFYTAAVLRWIIDMDANAPTGQDRLADAFVLVHGRKYLPLKLRRQVRKAFAKKHGEKLAGEIAATIDAYLPIVFPKQASKAEGLVVKLHDLMAGVPRLPLIDMDGGHKVDQHGRPQGQPVNKGRALVENQKEASEAVEDMMAEDAQDEADAEKEEAKGQSRGGSNWLDDTYTDDEDGDGGDEMGEHDGQDADVNPNEGSPGGTPGQGKQGGSAGGGDTDTPSSGEADIPSGDGHGKGVGSSSDSAPGSTQAEGTVQDILDDLRRDMADALNDVLNDEDMKSEVKDTVDGIKQSLKQHDSGIDISGRHAERTLVPPTQVATSSVNRVVKVLREIHVELEPGWHARQHSGRLDPHTMVSAIANPWNTDIFRLWDEGREDETTAEVVIAVDMSSSMSVTTMHKASEAMWIIKSAFDKLQIRTTCLGFNTSATVLIQGSEHLESKHIPVFGSAGGTDPSEALEWAYRIFARSSAANRIMVIITDGQWGGGYGGGATTGATPEALIKSMNNKGIITAIVGLDSAVKSYGKHGCKIGRDMNSPAELPKFAKEIVMGVMREVQRHASVNVQD